MRFKDFMRVSFMADDCLQRTLCSDSTLFSPLYRGILIFIEALYASKRVLYGIIRLSDRCLCTLPPPQLNRSLSDILWGWNWKLNCWSKLWSNFEGRTIFVVISEKANMPFRVRNPTRICGFSFSPPSKNKGSKRISDEICALEIQFSWG